MYQQITLVGNLGSEPEMKYTPSGVPVATFSVAINKSWVAQDGTKQEKVTWVRVTTWRKLAENCSQYLSKGRQVFVVGEVEESAPYEGRDGVWRSSINVTASTVRFLGQNGGSSSTYNGTEPPAHVGSNGNIGYGSGGGQPESDSDIPF